MRNRPPSLPTSLQPPSQGRLNLTFLLKSVKSGYSGFPEKFTPVSHLSPKPLFSAPLASQTGITGINNINPHGSREASLRLVTQP